MPIFPVAKAWTGGKKIWTLSVGIGGAAVVPPPGCQATANPRAPRCLARRRGQVCGDRRRTEGKGLIGDPKSSWIRGAAASAPPARPCWATGAPLALPSIPSLGRAPARR